MNSNPANLLRLKTRRSGFTLVELLAVMVIIGLLAAFAAPALNAIKGNEVSRAVYNVSDVLGEARCYAMAKNTYVYVGVAEDTSQSAGQMVIGVVASSQGTQMFSPANPAPTSSSNTFIPISPLLRVDNVETTSLPDAGIQRQAVPASDKMGDPSFNEGNPLYSFAVGSYVFSSTPGIANPPGVSSQGMLQIDPQGVVSEVGGNLAPLLEIGLAPVHGNRANTAAVQIAGVSGAVRIYRP